MGAAQLVTVRVGAMVVCEHEIGLRLVECRQGAGATYHLIAGGELGKPHPDEEAALRDADVSYPGVAWRPDLAPREDEAPCPICSAPTSSTTRYPSILCVACVLEAVDGQGRSVRFTNVAVGGGFCATLEDGTELGEQHTCFVRGRRCHADEAYFGGIVVTLAG